jgi:hypothetical protein
MSKTALKRDSIGLALYALAHPHACQWIAAKRGGAPG